ncbi:MAG: S9 family peptidase [Acidimicrobiales bacterium]|nr:S9 family peptidase [Acidimicrobiales bacterium]
MGRVQSSDVLEFPRAYAETQRFSLGAPRSFTIIDDGKAVLFLRSASGTSPSLSLWALDMATGQERVVVDPASLGVADDLTPEEQARRERARESAGGIVRYAVAESASIATFVLDGAVYLVDVPTQSVREVGTATPAFDPRLSPDGTAIAYVCNSELRVVTLGTDPTSDRDRTMSPAEPNPAVSWGLAEFVAGEEMNRTRGFWWSPESDALLATRVDVSEVQRWYIGDPAHPATAATEIRYPAAGTPNARVSLHHIPLSGDSNEINWQTDGLEYLADVAWSEDGPLYVAQSRDQRTTSIVSIDVHGGTTAELRVIGDAHWTELQPGAPQLRGGVLYTIEDLPDRRALCIDGTPASELPTQVRSIVSIEDDGVIVTASLDDPTQIHLLKYPADGGGCQRLSDEPGVHGATAASGTMVVSTAMPTSPVTSFTVSRGDASYPIRSHAADPTLRAEPEFLFLGERGLAIALFLPSDHNGTSPLPVLLDPYGGPHAQRVLRTHNPHLVSRWFAENGYAVIVTDGRGTPGRGPAFEREVWGDLAGPVLEDQLAALDAVAKLHPYLDINRVGIRGWSFGGYLAALAAMRMPERIHAAIAGAPVTEWKLYDTHYTERYLGHPDIHPDHYQRSSLLPDAPSLSRPLLLIHGLADDNVVAAHTLQLSSALLAHGRPHRVLPLSGVTHMTPQAVVAQNLLRLQLDFLDEHLNDPTGGSSS